MSEAKVTIMGIFFGILLLYFLLAQRTEINTEKAKMYTQCILATIAAEIIIMIFKI